MTRLSSQSGKQIGNATPWVDSKILDLKVRKWTLEAPVTATRDDLWWTSIKDLPLEEVRTSLATRRTPCSRASMSWVRRTFKTILLMEDKHTNNTQIIWLPSRTIWMVGEMIYRPMEAPNTMHLYLIHTVMIRVKLGQLKILNQLSILRLHLKHLWWWWLATTKRMVSGSK